jgi:FkbM family methyltransferase
MKATWLSISAAHLVVGFYRFWHGTLGLKGAGRLINHGAPRLKGLQCYPLRLPNGRIASVDFRELSAFGWLNTILGDHNQEQRLIEAIASCLTPQSVFWDIGANAGILSSEIAARVQPLEHHFFEPNPRIFPWAEKALEHMPHAHGHPVAISRETGVAVLSIPRNRSAYGSLEACAGGDSDQVEVETVTGDILVYDRKFTPPDIIKIDTEGHEVDVIAGMSRLIDEHQPLIFFEHIELSDQQVAGLVPPGYLLGTLCDRTGVILETFDRSAGHNSVLSPLPQATAG